MPACVAVAQPTVTVPVDLRPLCLQATGLSIDV